MYFHMHLRSQLASIRLLAVRNVSCTYCDMHAACTYVLGDSIVLVHGLACNDNIAMFAKTELLHLFQLSIRSVLSLLVTLNYEIAI